MADQIAQAQEGSPILETGRDLPKGQKPAGAGNLDQLKAIANAMFQAEKVAESSNVTEDGKLDAGERSAFETLKGIYTTNQANFDAVVDAYLDAKIQKNLALASKKEMFKRDFLDKFRALVEEHEGMMEFRLQDMKKEFTFLKEEVADIPPHEITSPFAVRFMTDEDIQAAKAEADSPLIFKNTSAEVVKTDWMSRIGGGTFLAVLAGTVGTVSMVASGASSHGLMMGFGSLLAFNKAKNDLFPPTLPDDFSPEGIAEIQNLANKYGVEFDFVRSLLTSEAVGFYEMNFGKKGGDRLSSMQKEVGKDFMNSIDFSDFRLSLENTINKNGCFSENWSVQDKKAWIETFLDKQGGKGLNFIHKMKGDYKTLSDPLPDGSGNMYDILYSQIQHFNENKIWTEKRASAYRGIGHEIDTTLHPDLLYKITYMEKLKAKYKPQTQTES